MAFSKTEDFKVGQCVYVKDPKTIGFIYQDEYDRQRHKELAQCDTANRRMVFKIQLTTGQIITAATEDVHRLAGPECELDHPDQATAENQLSAPERQDSVRPISPFVEKSYQKTQNTFEYSSGHLRSPIPGGQTVANVVEPSMTTTTRSRGTAVTRTVQKLSQEQRQQSSPAVPQKIAGGEHVESDNVDIEEVELEPGAVYKGIAQNSLHTDALLRDDLSNLLSTRQCDAVQQKIAQQRDLELTENDDELVKQPSVRPTSISSPFGRPAAPVFNPRKVIQQGIVQKNGESMFDTWRVRRFVQTADMYIRYYDGQKLKGEIDLRSASAVYSTCAEGQYWTIVTSSRKWSLWCETRSQTQQWISSIQHAIQHLH